jgi:hypothetical protein
MGVLNSRLVGLDAARTDPRTLAPSLGLRRPRDRWDRILMAVLTAAAMPACASSDETVRNPTQESRLYSLGSESQQGTVGAHVPIPPAVRIEDQINRPHAGVVVHFTVISGGGAVSDTVVLSDAQGVARVGSWTLGPLPAVNALTASVIGGGNSPITFYATGVAR